jgi:hypothetical protein
MSLSGRQPGRVHLRRGARSTELKARCTSWPPFATVARYRPADSRRTPPPSPDRASRHGLALLRWSRATPVRTPCAAFAGIKGPREVPLHTDAIGPTPATVAIFPLLGAAGPQIGVDPTQPPDAPLFRRVFPDFAGADWQPERDAQGTLIALHLDQEGALSALFHPPSLKLAARQLGARELHIVAPTSTRLHISDAWAPHSSPAELLDWNAQIQASQPARATPFACVFIAVDGALIGLHDAQGRRDPTGAPLEEPRPREVASGPEPIGPRILLALLTGALLAIAWELLGTVPS